MLTVVIGPPAGGKSTWVAENAKPGDVVIDYDKLAVALTAPGGDSHDHVPAVAAVAQAARTAAIRTAMQHAATVDVYLIHSSPGQARMSEYAAMGARIVTIDPGRDEAHRRAGRERPKRMHAVIDAWYRDHGHGATPERRGLRPGPKAGAGSDPRGTWGWKQLRGQVFREETHCWRCGGWVDQSLPAEHAMSRTADHLDPVGVGGAGVPDRSRVRLAHRSCNSSRGTGQQPARSVTVTLSEI